MSTNGQMHPEDFRNLILFIVTSIALWLAYDHFILQPKMEDLREAQRKQELVKQNAPTGGEAIVEKPREAIIAETKNRLKIDNPAVFGSINLRGGRVDDLSLHNYYKTVKEKKNVVLLSPAGSPYPRYVEYGWVPADEDIRVPGRDTLWQVSGADTLTSQTPVTLTWNNGQGLTFEREISLDEHYGFNVKQRVRNNSGRPVTLFPYALVTEHGLPEEYFGRWIVHEGPVGYIGGELIERSYKDMAEKARTSITSESGWIGISEKYWLAALIPDQQEEIKYSFVYTPDRVPGEKEKYQTDILGQPHIVEPGDNTEFNSHFFAGAKKVSLLEEYEKQWNVPHFDLAVDFGLFYFLTRPFFAVLNFFYGIVGNFGVAIIMFTVVLRILVFPLANTSFRSFAKLRQVSPQMMDLREKYKDDKQKLQEELVKLYQKEKVNPMAGCLPILVQIPIFFALFKVLSVTIEMRHAPFFGWIQDLSAPDPTSIFNLFGLLPWSLPDFLIIGAWPCLMLLTMIIQRNMSPPPQDKMQATMIAAMPYVMTFVLAKFASGLVIYWTFNNLLSVVQQYIIMRSMGVEVHLFNKSKKDKEMEEAVQEGPSVHPGAEYVEEEVEEAMFGDHEEEQEKKTVTKPKPKKSKKKK